MLPPSKKFTENYGQAATVYRMPNWVVEDLAYRKRFTKSQFSELCQVKPQSILKTKRSFARFQHLCGSVDVQLTESLPKIYVTDVFTGDHQPQSNWKRILLKKKAKTDWRQELIVALAKMLLGNEELPFDYDESDTPLFEAIINDPVAAEAKALDIWNDFIEQCQIPSSFLVSTRPPLNLEDLFLLRPSIAGVNREKRQQFAETYPSATRSILKSGNFDSTRIGFDAVDRKRRSFRHCAAQQICQFGFGDCPKANKLAARLPRHCSNGRLDSLLSDRRFSKILVGVLDNDKNAMLHIVRDISLAKRQFKRAIDFSRAYLRLISKNGFEVAYSLAILLARMMVRAKFEPDERLVPEEIVKGIAAVSVDSLSTFVAKKLANNLDFELLSDEGAKAVLNKGVMTILRCFGNSSPPSLSIHQFIDFASGAYQDSQYESTFVESFPDIDWQTPAVMDAVLENWSSDVKIEVITNQKRLIDEVSMTKNSGYMLYEVFDARSALLGMCVFISMIAPDGRATLCLTPSSFNDGKYPYFSWQKRWFIGRRNETPSPMCSSAATTILSNLQKQGTFNMETENINRFNWLLEQLDQSAFKSYCEK